MSRIIMFVASASSRPLYSQKLYGRQNCPSGLCHSHVSHKKDHHHRPTPEPAANNRTVFEIEQNSEQQTKAPTAHQPNQSELPTPAISSPKSSTNKNVGPWAPQFYDQSQRRVFLRNVYAMLTFQFVVILGLIALFLHGDRMRRWTFEDKIPFFTLLAISAILLIFLFWKDFLRMKFPFNAICFLVLTFVLSLLLSAAAATFSAYVIPVAVGTIAILCFTLAVANLQTTVDFTDFLPGFALVFHLILLMIIMIIFSGQHFPVLSIALVVSLFVMSYLIWDFQRMMRDQNEYYIVGPDHHTFAVLNVFVDVVGIFISCFTCNLVTSGESSNLSHV